MKLKKTKPPPLLLCEGSVRTTTHQQPHPPSPSQPSGGGGGGEEEEHVSLSSAILDGVRFSFSVSVQSSASDRNLNVIFLHLWAPPAGSRSDVLVTRSDPSESSDLRCLFGRPPDQSKPTCKHLSGVRGRGY